MERGDVSVGSEFKVANDFKLAYIFFQQFVSIKKEGKKFKRVTSHRVELASALNETSKSWKSTKTSHDPTLTAAA